MDRPMRRLVAAPLLLVLSFSLLGCGSGGGATPSPSTGPTPPPPSPSAAATGFKLTVVPTAFTGLIHSGAKAILLVSVDGSPGDGPVELAASAAGAQTSVEPARLLPGAVAEVTVTGLACPSVCDGVTAQVTVVATRGAIVQRETRAMTLTPEPSQLEADARAHLAPFISWLAANRPELGITATTAFESVAAPWVLIVEHHLFFSKDWEIDISWHVMIPPDDWSQIVLRHRGTELAPSLAFKIDSVSGKTTPHEITPPEAVWR